jgi:tight adherence protein C
VPLERALATLAERLPQREIRAFCAALDRARRHGTPLGRTLAGQARDARLALRRRVQEDAARAAPKIQLVVALLLVPSVLLMVAAALISALLGGHGGGALPLGP